MYATTPRDTIDRPSSRLRALPRNTNQWHRLYQTSMNLRIRVKRAFTKLPAPVTVALGFGTFIAVSLLLAFALPPRRDVNADCASQCAPRHGKVVADKNYPMSKGNHRMVCECQ